VLYQALKIATFNCKAQNCITKKYAKPADGKAVDYILGQAYFLRAVLLPAAGVFIWRKLHGSWWRGWRKNGRADLCECPADLSSTQQPRSSVKDVWAFVENDLKQAASLLAGKTWSGADLGRITEWAAKGMLGKAYVYTQDWANAKTTLLDV